MDNAQSLLWKNENPEKIKEAKRVASIKHRAESGKKSRCVGVKWDKDTQRWRAYISYEGRQYILIRTKNLELAIQRRKESEKHVNDKTFLEWMRLMHDS